MKLDLGDSLRLKADYDRFFSKTYFSTRLWDDLWVSFDAILHRDIKDKCMAGFWSSLDWTIGVRLKYRLRDSLKENS